MYLAGSVGKSGTRFDACWVIATMKAELSLPVVLILGVRKALTGLLGVETMLCELCQSEDAYNFHHFIPRTLHTNKWFKRRYTRQEMQQGIEVCKSCHSAIHDLIPDEKELGRNYNTKKKLNSHAEVGKYIRWKRKRRPSKSAKRRGRTEDQT